MAKVGALEQARFRKGALARNEGRARRGAQWRLPCIPRRRPRAGTLTPRAILPAPWRAPIPCYAVFPALLAKRLTIPPALRGFARDAACPCASITHSHRPP